MKLLVLALVVMMVGSCFAGDNKKAFAVQSEARSGRSLADDKDEVDNYPESTAHHGMNGKVLKMYDHELDERFLLEDHGNDKVGKTTAGSSGNSSNHYIPRCSTNKMMVTLELRRPGVVAVNKATLS
ncbi:hypothetical protein GH714_014659 [Hevea brasiliensis]|uniref:Uncharacterized protein n=1 Tax=Hevea brasiliensis TaxID=3981 RepID=A0A6A6KVT9_HEVBR|nr:hypothetical protein GH714_014659 [Hevea brasiliensis]